MTPTFRRAGLLFAIFLIAPVLAADPPETKKAVKTFTNSKTDLTGERADHYVEFSFDYPADWTLDRQTGDKNPNFVAVDRSAVRPGAKDTLENFNVGTFYGKGSSQKAVLARKGETQKLKVRDQIMDPLKAFVAKSFPDAKVTGEGLTKVGAYDGYELRFAFEIKPKTGEPLNVWGRIILVPNPDAKANGVMLAMLGTSVALELKTEKDLGTKGDLPVILNSFKFGKRAKP